MAKEKTLAYERKKQHYKQKSVYFALQKKY